MSTYVLRPYQNESVEAGVAFMEKPGAENGIIVLPCGAGKSLVIAAIAKRLGGRCLVFAPSQELLAQDKSKMEAFGVSPAIYSASFNSREVGDITLATIGSVKNRSHLFEAFQHVMVDECHLVNSRGGMYADFFGALEGRKVLGFTGTPYRLSHDAFGGAILKFLTRTRPRIFSKVVHVVQNGDLFDQGFLCKLDYKIVKTGFDPARLRLNSTGADYTDESVQRHFAELNFDDQIVRCIHRLHELGRRGTIVFCRFVEGATYVAERIPGAEVVSAKTPQRERERIIEGFRAGEIPVVANSGVLIHGFDHPPLSNCILASPTCSLARFYQMVGRCVRPHPSKESAFVVDMVGLTNRFGRIEDLRIIRGSNEKWFVSGTGNRQLTNIYFGEVSPERKKWAQRRWSGGRKWRR
jgi:DNA repair protein RadD